MTASLHEGQPVLTTGDPLEEARAVVIMLHGRGATARDILTLAPELQMPGWSFLAPQAAGGAWYPYPFMAPIENNEPWLSSALEVIASLIARAEAARIPPQHTLLLGFSQGACLALEYAARNARRYGGVAGLSGGLIGPDEHPSHPGSMDGTPVFLGCSDHDPYIPAERVKQAAGVFGQMGSEVTAILYPDLQHEVNPDEIQQVRRIMERVSQTASEASRQG